MDIRAFISSLFRSAADAEDYRRRLFLLIATGIGTPTLAVMTLLDIERHMPTLTVVAAIGVVLLLMNLYYLSRPLFDHRVPRIVLFYVCLLMIVYVLQTASGKSLIWPLMIPLVAVFVFGSAEGLIWSIAFAIALGIAIAWTRINSGASFHGAWIDFILAYVNLSVIAYGYETLRRRAQTDAAQRAQRLQRFVDTSSDWLFELDSELRFTYVSPRWEHITGIPIAGILGSSIFEQAPYFYHGDIESALQPLRDHLPFRDFEYSFAGADGHKIFVSARGNPYFDDKGAFLGYTGTGTDITAYEESRLLVKETEHQLAQAQKMESIGQLTSGIAHDFNNLLTVIMGYVDLLKSSGSANPTMLDALDQAATRASQLTKRLLSFSREQVATAEVVDVGSLLREMTTLLTRTLGARIQLHLHTGDETLTTMANFVQFESAVLNLAINARDAMEGAGNLTIDMQRAKLREQPARGDFVMVRVTDDGCGISPELVDRVREPFFTTKPEGVGTGLGLAMVNGFVSQCDGTMSIDSEPGRGTSVTLYFPLSTQGIADDSPIQPVLPASHPRTVLVVEDNDDLAQIVVAMLQSHGHVHYLRQSAEEALAAIDAINPEVVISDVQLGGNLSGIDLAKRLRSRRPCIELILITGYPDKFDSELDHVFILPKPFTRARLLAAVECGDVCAEERHTS